MQDVWARAVARGVPGHHPKSDRVLGRQVWLVCMHSNLICTCVYVFLVLIPFSAPRPCTCCSQAGRRRCSPSFPACCGSLKRIYSMTIRRCVTCAMTVKDSMPCFDRCSKPKTKDPDWRRFGPPVCAPASVHHRRNQVFLLSQPSPHLPSFRCACCACLLH